MIASTGTASGIGAVNPLLYRGYYYDAELGMYYLQSRYYDPAVKRFVNADSVEYLGASESAISLNLFAYCGNNPVNATDHDGKISTRIIDAGISAIVAVIIEYLVIYIKAAYQKATIDAKKLATKLLIAGAKGFLGSLISSSILAKMRTVVETVHAMCSISGNWIKKILYGLLNIAIAYIGNKLGKALGSSFKISTLSSGIRVVGYSGKLFIQFSFSIMTTTLKESIGYIIKHYIK